MGVGWWKRLYRACLRRSMTTTTLNPLTPPHPPPQTSYIQTAVRTVQQREQQALTAAGLTTYLAPGTSGGIQRGASLTRRPSGGPYPMTRERSQGSRVASHRAVEVGMGWGLGLVGGDAGLLWNPIACLQPLPTPPAHQTQSMSNTHHTNPTTAGPHPPPALLPPLPPPPPRPLPPALPHGLARLDARAG